MTFRDVRELSWTRVLRYNNRMNYFAHGCRYTDNPYFLAGTAIPDWLNVADRRVRARTRGAEPLIDDSRDEVAQIARGIVQHHDDDAWFHQTRAFAELSLSFAVEIRDLLPADDGFRPSFLGHILVEILLDDVLIGEDPVCLERYYAALGDVDPELIQQTVNRIASRSTTRLSALIPRFCDERFLCDYAEDEKLLSRLNAVMRRVRLPELPESMLEFFGEARDRVRGARAELLVNWQPASPERG